jgi:L-threonylcarbamoyladenylate synthase
LTSSIHINRAARILLRGGVVAYPTEAVYGLGCLPGDRHAVARVLRIKRRSWRKGLVLIAAEIGQLKPLIRLPREPMLSKILLSWPGPATWVVRATAAVPAWITGGRDTVAVRVTNHPVAEALCRRVGQPLVSTSANRSRQPPHTQPLRLRRELGRAVDYVLPGELGNARRPTTIRDGATGRVLRPG